MAAERNDTPWQQGSVISAPRAKELGILDAENQDDSVVVVISHDCDLTESSNLEPNCEVLVGRKIAEVDGNYSKGKNPRRLHLTFSSGQTSISAEFSPDSKIIISKSNLFESVPDAE